MNYIDEETGEIVRETALVLPTDTELARYQSDESLIALSEHVLERGKAELAELRTIEDVYDRRAKVDAISRYIDQTLRDRDAKIEARNNLTELILRYQRQIGAWLREMPREKRGGNRGNQYLAKSSDGTLPTLSDLSISNKQSSRWQRQASVPEPVFEDLIASAKENLWELSSYDIEKWLKELERQAKKEEQDTAAALAVTAPVVTAAVELPPMVRVGDHLFLCADSHSEAVATYLETLPPIALVFADIPYNADVAEWDRGGYVWHADYLADLAAIVAVTPGISNIHNFMQQTSMPYRWSTSTHISNGMTRGALGFGNWIYTAIFSHLNSLHRNAQDISVISITGDAHELGAKRQKPPQYLAWLFQLLTNPGDLIVDPFAGSGTSALVAAGLGRRSVNIEIDPQTFQQMVQRVATALDQPIEEVTDGNAL